MILLPSSTEPPVGGMDIISPDVVDGAMVWDTLDDEQKKAIGAAAIEMAAARSALDQALLCAPDGLPSSRASEAAVDAAERQFIQVVREWNMDDLFLDGLARQMLPSCLGAVCRRCGCSQNDACAEGCGWAEENLCTSCVGPSLKTLSSA